MCSGGALRPQCNSCFFFVEFFFEFFCCFFVVFFFVFFKAILWPGVEEGTLLLILRS